MKIQPKGPSVITQGKKEFNQLPRLRQIGLMGAEAARQQFNQTNNSGIYLKSNKTAIGRYLRLRVGFYNIIKNLRIGLK